MHIVTTKHRGVFAGTITDRSGRGITLANARMAVYWSCETHGVVGLAATGPAAGSRITRAAPRIEPEDVTAVMDMTDEAIAAGEAEPWG